MGKDNCPRRQPFRQFLWWSCHQFLPSLGGIFSPLFNYWRIFIRMTATFLPTTYHIFLRKHYLMSTTFFNVTIVCCTNSRASAIFFQQGQLPAAPTLPPIFGGRVRQFFFLQPIFAQFFQNWRKSANWLTICTPVFYSCFCPLKLFSSFKTLLFSLISHY